MPPAVLTGWWTVRWWPEGESHLPVDYETKTHQALQTDVHSPWLVWGKAQMVQTCLRLHERESSLNLYCPLQNSNKSNDIKGCRVSLTETGLISAERCYVPHSKVEGKPQGMANAGHTPLKLAVLSGVRALKTRHKHTDWRERYQSKLIRNFGVGLGSVLLSLSLSYFYVPHYSTRKISLEVCSAENLGVRSSAAQN